MMESLAPLVSSSGHLVQQQVFSRKCCRHVLAPELLQDCGIIFQAEGAPLELVAFASKSKIPLAATYIEKIQKAIGAKVPKGMKLNKVTRLHAIIEQMMPDISPQECDAFIYVASCAKHTCLHMTWPPPCHVCVVSNTWHLVSGVLEEKVDIVNGVAHGDAMNAAKEDPLLVEAMAHLAPSEAKHFEDEEVHLVSNEGLQCGIRPVCSPFGLGCCTNGPPA
jgi:hypothetical protein